MTFIRLKPLKKKRFWVYKRIIFPLREQYNNFQLSNWPLSTVLHIQLFSLVFWTKSIKGWTEAWCWQRLIMLSSESTYLFYCFIFLVHSLLQWNPKLLKRVSFWISKKVESPSKLQELKKVSLVEHQQT